MVLSCVDLLDYPAYPGTVPPHQDEQIFRDETYRFVSPHNFNMGESLFVRADLVLAFHYEHAAFTEDTGRLHAGFSVEPQHCFVVLRVCAVPGTVVLVVFLKRFMPFMRRSSWRVHIRRVEHDAVNLAVCIRQGAAIYTVSQVGGKKAIPIVRKRLSRTLPCRK